MTKLSCARPSVHEWRRFYCPICGHVEWVAPGENLPSHYACPLCGVNASVMFDVHDPRLLRHKVRFEEVSRRVYRVDKTPTFPSEYQHFAYVLAHPSGVYLFDAPPLLTDEALSFVRSLEDKGQSCLSFPKRPPVVPATRAIVERPIALLATCMGLMDRPEEAIVRLLSCDTPCARPWADDLGGVLFDGALHR